jgi:hypothetical protein
MVLAKSKASVGLGNTLMNDRFGKGKGSDRKKGAGVTRINHATGEEVRSVLNLQLFKLSLTSAWAL